MVIFKHGMQNIRSPLKIKKENVSNETHFFVLPHRMLIPFSRERCKVFIFSDVIKDELSCDASVH